MFPGCCQRLPDLPSAHPKKPSHWGNHMQQQAGSRNAAHLSQNGTPKFQCYCGKCMKMRINHTRWCPSSLAKLVNITPISLVYGRYNELVFMGFINQLITEGAPSCRVWGIDQTFMAIGQVCSNCPEIGWENRWPGATWKLAASRRGQRLVRNHGVECRATHRTGSKWRSYPPVDLHSRENGGTGVNLGIFEILCFWLNRCLWCLWGFGRWLAVLRLHSFKRTVHEQIISIMDWRLGSNIQNVEIWWSSTGLWNQLHQEPTNHRCFRKSASRFCAQTQLRLASRLSPGLWKKKSQLQWIKSRSSLLHILFSTPSHFTSI